MIVFENPGEIDVVSISTFGVSVKEGETPIGFFGTGLKYAIAVLLRSGHEITVFSGRQVVEFGLSQEVVRGKSFQFVTMAVGTDQAQPIGFTTELGKQWELWMAYREIACNCKDEQGTASRAVNWPQPEAGKTKIIVKGDAFESVFAESHFYILEDAPYATIGTVEVRKRAGHSFFYRGVRVHQFQRAGLFTYNDNAQLELTEDRTVKEQYQPAYRIARALLQANDESLLREVLTADSKTLEGSLDFHGWGVAPSDAFLRVVGDCVSDRMTKVNPTAFKVWSEATSKPFTPREIELTAVQSRSMERALDFCGRIGFQIRGSYPIKVVESLGEGCLGLAQDRTIFIAERVFHLGGTKQLASTLIEEYLHLRHGWKDLTRELQSFLFEKLVSVGEELVGEPL
ncbi:hypothetical protein CBM2637_A140083 [Cupriavidus taiwanensis]|uniref:hypothetical protein n=1 Tax=Cupriavidus taiwanensis TaxID=164546 RepID=UPI000E18823F|nr:hypothetical protein [Cupriavidus taiwanensis]SPA24547.1 hypothetical protein CBM2637_A140083 [Cupriavidus taiwanensis]